jgi:hypothetical protein
MSGAPYVDHDRCSCCSRVKAKEDANNFNIGGAQLRWRKVSHPLPYISRDLATLSLDKVGEVLGEQ